MIEIYIFYFFFVYGLSTSYAIIRNLSILLVFIVLFFIRMVCWCVCRRLRSGFLRIQYFKWFSNFFLTCVFKIHRRFSSSHLLQTFLVSHLPAIVQPSNYPWTPKITFEYFNSNAGFVAFSIFFLFQTKN